MSVGINDNISKIYQAQQTVRQTTSNQTAVANSFSAQNKKSEKLKKIGIGVCAALGVAASLAVLAKFDKSKSYTINPLKMFRGKLKDSYIFSTEYKTKEIAEILKIPENTVKTRLLNGRKLLKTKLEGWEDE